ncbi:hypothetical protein O0I10_000736 [Lichtheimia ornata]|uniref:Uncharacterized protein n=1 Tax=Lichtheimia ornata TaxID=688661 RepID=A0AAD8DHS9_9FUNG|nr:uncharacterized protein O0I10_000736 [Lichtheimia ornata]KAJ8663494.1 hypothetical protein O0I10_000736 [Lichtheimia ornata]
MYSVHWGEHVVNGNTFQLQTFNNKYARDLPMTQASIAIQRVAVLSFIQDPKGTSRVVCMLSMVVIKESRNLLLLWVCRHEKRMLLLPYTSFTVAWTCWMMVPLAATRYGSQSKNAVWLAQWYAWMALDVQSKTC